MTLEQRNAQKLNNLINLANINAKNKDIYFFIKCNVKVLLNKLKLSSEDLEILSGHMSAFTNEMAIAKWDLRKFEPKLYQKFLNVLFNKIDFRKADNELMFKCRDLLEISPIKDDLYKKQMAFLDAKLPKIENDNNNQKLKSTQNNLLKTTKVVNNQNNHTINLQSQPVNPFADNKTTYFQNQPVNPFADTNITQKQNKPVNPFGDMTQKPTIINVDPNNQNPVSSPVNPFADMNPNSDPYNNMNIGASPYQINFENNLNNNNGKATILRSIPKNGLNNINNNMAVNNNFNIDPYKPKVIPEYLKENIIKELKLLSSDIADNNKITSCRMHSIEALLYFKQIFPD